MVVDRRQFKPREWRDAALEAPEVSRPKLIPIENADATYTAVFHTISEFPGGITQLFKHVCLDGQAVVDHVWMKENYFWRGMRLQPGDRIQFIARCGRYVKGTGADRRLDFCLYYPRDVRRLP